MKSLSEYLDDDFTLADKREILDILKAYRLSNIIDKLILLLKRNPNEVQDIGIISSGLVISVNNNIKAPEYHQRKIELLFADLIFIIFTDFLKKKASGSEPILEEIKRQSLTTCNLMGYDFNVFKKLIDAYAVHSIYPDFGSTAKITTSLVEMPKSKLIWTGKGRLEELVYQLGTRKLIKSKGPFFDLFLNAPSEHILVKWDFERKGHLAHLLYELYKKDIISIASNRGYFSYAEKHFIGLDGALLKPNSLKKLSSAIHMQPLRHHKTISDITEIIDKVISGH